MKKQQTYGLFTMIMLMVGIVIGSGIYFKADDIFRYTDGNILVGLFVLALGAVCIIFGSLTLTTISKQTKASGGLMAYFDAFVSTEMAAGFGWFQCFVYTPSVAVVVSWAAAIYTWILVGVEATLLQQIALGMGYFVIFFVINLLSRSWGGYIQNISTVIKMIPLVVIAFYGIFLAPPLSWQAVGGSTFVREIGKWSWLSALVPLTFAYDGWTVVLHAAPEVRNSEKNVTRALALSPIVIMLSYVLYVFGISKILGSEAIIKLGDSAINAAVAKAFGTRAANLVMVIVVISVLGVLNALTLSGIRMPQALAEKGMIPDHGISHKSEKTQLSVKSGLIFLGCVFVWAILHYFVMRFNILNGRDISEISIVFNFLIYILLYKAVFQYRKKNQSGGLWSPIMAILGSIVILIGSILASPVYVVVFLCFCTLVVMLGYQYMKRKI
ncbi:MAG: APC family permease [Peptoniphilaceae bacterium]|nr:APC family permease [Peptoniphilaceae bacterium]MDD7434101.1 APC family permease [Peptoniphilaceae bacterium]MDY3075423.1 APC family permease [Peptoniphilaceae bacterium]MDY3986433.1 APC family permease [Peptoniphilaceae bacterium]MDY4197077.1 APC family permease [Peptoniphilaceae bacterium]